MLDGDDLSHPRQDCPGFHVFNLVCNLKLTNCLFLEFSVCDFWAMVDCDHFTFWKAKLQIREPGARNL
jgi:hypothetical protein